VHPSSPPILVLMGVSGCGKSTVGGVLAGRLGWAFGEGDDLHPQANVDKMAAGHPLTDADRWPWLARVHDWMAEQLRADRPGIITCSALRRSYRDLLIDGIAEHVVFVYLRGDHDQLLTRLRARQGHFMPTALLDSQLADLEPPGPDEQAITVDIGSSPTVQAQQIVDMIGL
jgi:gluconokinase